MGFTYTKVLAPAPATLLQYSVHQVKHPCRRSRTVTSGQRGCGHWGAYGTGCGCGAGNLLKPMLGRGELHCIGATTLAEYRKYIEKDAALERRFQQVLVEPPSVTETVSILRGLRER